jgi:hypothetical protein
MKFPGHWVSTHESSVIVKADVFDETDLSQASGWMEAHQNADAALPQGHRDPARVIAEAARQWLVLHPEIAQTISMEEGGEFVIHNVEDFGRLCLQLAGRLVR